MPRRRTRRARHQRTRKPRPTLAMSPPAPVQIATLIETPATNDSFILVLTSDVSMPFVSPSSNPAHWLNLQIDSLGAAILEIQKIPGFQDRLFVVTDQTNIGRPRTFWTTPPACFTSVGIPIAPSSEWS